MEYSSTASAAATSGSDAEGGDHYVHSDTIKKESHPRAQLRQQQHQQDQDQDQEQHHYMSLYEPLLVETEAAEADTCPSSSQTTLPSQQPDKTSSSSSPAVAEKSPPSPQSRINNTTSIHRTKKRQKVDCSENGVAESSMQSLVQEGDTGMTVDEQFAHIIKTFLDDADDSDDISINIGDGRDSVTDGRVDNVDDDNARFDSSDDEAVVKHLKQKIESKPQPVSADAAAAPAECVGNKSIGNCTNPSSTSIRIIHATKHDAKWYEMYQRLVAFTKEHAAIKVPLKYNKDPRLKCWVQTQRHKNITNKMPEKRTRLLNSIGFVWDARAPEYNTSTWEEMFQRLVAYKMQHGHANVPRRCKEDRQLGRWASYQRILYKTNELTEERKRFLNHIVFVWDGNPPGTSTARRKCTND